MAIYTRFGSPVKIVAKLSDWDKRTSYRGDYLAVERVEDGKQFTCTWSDLRADDIREIDAAIELAETVQKL